MSLEILNQLENSIQQAANTINTLKQENAALKNSYQELEMLINESSDESKTLREENEALKKEQQLWQQRLEILLNKVSEISQ